ncbi:PREDICTED: protein msta [Bactrocera latifrons]|uniref:Protein msta, isoform B n=1 Tax=Bactrocera latifrons TaxID=174628 RepID=A0A0K8UXH9_BACLA|nr:PREDICTED: protein msta [Bactrocera latifrons]
MSTSPPDCLTTNNCAVCQTPAKLYCSACKLVKYCGADHQRQHWKQHKTECRPFRIAKDKVLGRYLKATRQIKAGTVIFAEMPIIVGPKWYLNEREEQVPVMPCVGCFTPCRMGAHHCPKCLWPTCSPNCGGLNNPNLHGLECSILMLGPGPASSDPRSLMDYYRSDALVVLKCLLLQRQNPKKWTELMDMQSHEVERIGSELHNDAEKRVVSYLQRNFLQRLKSVEQKQMEKYLQEYDTAVLHRICGIIETNYMCISLPSGMELSGVYYTACMMEHACQPNCYFQFDQRKSFRISVIAGRDIERDEHLIIMYSNMLWGTQMRQEHLAMTKHFLCKCERCTDPTEYGSNFSTMLCMGDEGESCDGIHLPKDPLNMKSDWACTKCPIMISGEEVRYLLTQMTEEVDNLLSRKPTVKQLEALINKLSKFLHPHHYHLFNLKHTLIQLYGTEIGYALKNLSDSLLNKKLHLCEELYDICQKLDPYTIRLSIYVGIILFEMQTVQIEQGKRLLANASKSEEQVATALNYFNSARENLLKAAKILEKELDNVAGSKLSDAVLKSLTELDTLINNYS